ncbi:hypothetical protein MTO96_000537 [Rhipicephalus appendiculatus]
MASGSTKSSTVNNGANQGAACHAATIISTDGVQPSTAHILATLVNTQVLLAVEGPIDDEPHPDSLHKRHVILNPNIQWHTATETLPVGANKRPLRELHTTPLVQAETPPDKTELSLPPPWFIATLPAETPVEGAPPTDDRRQRGSLTWRRHKDQLLGRTSDPARESSDQEGSEFLVVQPSVDPVTSSAPTTSGPDVSREIQTAGARRYPLRNRRPPQKYQAGV